MRSAYQGGWGSLLVGFCYGGKEPAMAGFGDQPTPRRAIDWRAIDPGARLWPRRENPALVTDGLSSYKSQALKVFREALHTGKVGRPKLALAEGLMIARVLKRYQRRR